MGNQGIEYNDHHVGVSYRAPDVDMMCDVKGAIAHPYTGYSDFVRYSNKLSTVNMRRALPLS